jgi:hypothetical protein
MKRLALAIGLVCVLSAALAMAGVRALDDAKQAEKKFTFIDFKDKGNHKLKEPFHKATLPGNDLDCFTPGEQTFADIKFKIGEKYIRLASIKLSDKPDKVEGIKVDKRFAKLHILHATGWSTDDDTIIGEYTITWEDDTTVTIPITYGKDVLDWWVGEDTAESGKVKIAWKGENEASKRNNRKIFLYLTTWENPKPDKKVKTIDYSTTKETMCAPFCVAMTAEE